MCGGFVTNYHSFSKCGPKLIGNGILIIDWKSTDVVWNAQRHATARIVNTKEYVGDGLPTRLAGEEL